MNWQIGISARNEPLRISSGQKVDVGEQSGADVVVTAIAPTEHPQDLALVFTTLLGASVNGSPLICPVVAVDPRGLNLSVRRRDTLLHLHVEPMPEVPGSGSQNCPICRMAMEAESPVRRCMWCERTYHAEPDHRTGPPASPRGPVADGF